MTLFASSGNARTFNYQVSPATALRPWRHSSDLSVLTTSEPRTTARRRRLRACFVRPLRREHVEHDPALPRDLQHGPLPGHLPEPGAHYARDDARMWLTRPICPRCAVARVDAPGPREGALAARRRHYREAQQDEERRRWACVKLPSQRGVGRFRVVKSGMCMLFVLALGRFFLLTNHPRGRVWGFTLHEVDVCFNCLISQGVQYSDDDLAIPSGCLCMFRFLR